ncbi:hypothetical protein [Pseudorhodoferax sp.]|uniref:hypothetical protein n=1 Tax=Pseudorhodoferax sp. TaxID=1993553 RepID=UPI0039E34624
MQRLEALNAHVSCILPRLSAWPKAFALCGGCGHADAFTDDELGHWMKNDACSWNAHPSSSFAADARPARDQGRMGADHAGSTDRHQ